MTSKKFQNFIQEDYKQIILRINFHPLDESIQLNLQFDLFYDYPINSYDYFSKDFFLRNVKVKNSEPYFLEQDGAPYYKASANGKVFIPRQLLTPLGTLKMKFKLLRGYIPLIQELKAGSRLRSGLSVFDPNSKRKEASLVLKETPRTGAVWYPQTSLQADLF